MHPKNADVIIATESQAFKTKVMTPPEKIFGGALL